MTTSQPLAADVPVVRSMDEYLAIPAVSASLIKRMINECPRAAWADSWLNPMRVIEGNKASDRGTIAHEILLEGSFSKVVCINPNDHPAEKTGAIPEGWTNKSIRAARDAAYAEGKIPMLADNFAAVRDMVEVAEAYIISTKVDEPAIYAAFYDGGASEETLVWQEGNTPCKLRVDRRDHDWKLIVDYKTTLRSVEPDAWGRTQLVGMGYYLSAAWYRRGVKAVHGVAPDYVFLAQQVDPPYLCSLIGVNPMMYEAADRLIEVALQKWATCVEFDDFPAYPTRVCYPEAPAYMLAKWEEQQLEELEAV